MKRRLALPVAALTIAAGTTIALAANSSAAPSATANALSSTWYASAPYLMPEDNSPPDVSTVMDATGQKAFQLAFILAPNGGGCAPTWGGTNAISSDTTIPAVISTIRGKGGDVSVSVGGYGGTKLGQTCGTVAATAAAYQQVVDKYGLHAIDFDLEEPEYENTQAIANELGAAQTLQKNNPGLYVSVTMPGTSAGTGWFGTQLLDQAKAIGFTPANFSIMPFDGGFSGAAAQVAALEAFHGLLESHLGWDSTTAYQHEGVSMMNGRTDASEYFYQADFQTVLDYATGHGLARYTYWSVNRDRQCNPPSNNGQLSGSCSSVPQNDWDFTKFTAKFAGVAVPPPPPSSSTSPSTPPSTTPSTPPSSSGSCTAATWNASTAYSGGAVVSYNGHTWTAKWWTQGD
ncbi:MAG: chitinase, partial [Catenulispora sp.]|nr:chitinase [Catenulispora sp.]